MIARLLLARTSIIIIVVIVVVPTLSFLFGILYRECVFSTVDRFVCAHPQTRDGYVLNGANKQTNKEEIKALLKT